MNASIIICTYNRAKSLSKTLESIKQMEVPKDLIWELIIVDNNSNDHTRDVVSDFMLQTNIRSQYVVEKKQGLSFARNCGISVKCGEITIFTDDDVVVDKFWLAEIMRSFVTSDASCVGGKIMPLWEFLPPKWLKKELYCYLALLDYGEKVLRMTQPLLWGANFAIRSYLFDKYGTFKSQFGRLPNKLYGFEETDLIDQLIRAGEKVLYCPSVIVHHCIPASRMKKSYFRKWRFDEGELTAIRSTSSEEKEIFGVPATMIKHFLREFKRYLHTLIVRPEDAFIKQLNVIFDAGYIKEKFIMQKRDIVSI